MIDKENGKNIELPEMLVGTSSPHIRTHETADSIMKDVIIALIPAMIGSIYFFGFAAAKLIVLSVASAVISEALIQKFFKKEVTIKDLSAVVTGILLAFNLPASAPWYLPVFGSAFAIIVVKQFFGGLGENFMNPALAGRAALLASWPAHMTNFVLPGVDATTGATPLAIMEMGGELPALKNMFFGNIGGTIGETSAILLLIGAAYLIYKGTIDWQVPAAYIGATTVTLAVIFVILGIDFSYLIYHILSGGLLLAGFFMVTDYASSPVSLQGRIVFAVGAGFLTAIIRMFGGYPEGVSYSILLMNVATPIIEKFTQPKVFGRAD